MTVSVGPYDEKKSTSAIAATSLPEASTDSVAISFVVDDDKEEENTKEPGGNKPDRPRKLLG